MSKRATVGNKVKKKTISIKQVKGRPRRQDGDMTERPTSC